MKCSDARRQMVKSLFGPPEAEGPLQEHLRNCPDCSERFAAYRRMKEEVVELEAAPFPGQVEDTYEERLGEALEQEPDGDLVPARPDPETPGAVKAAIVVVALVGLVGMTVLAMAVFRGDYEPPSPVGRLAQIAGTVQVQDPGAPRWREARAGEDLMPGAMVRSEGDGSALLTTDLADWRLDGFAAIGFGRAGEYELLQGRVHGACRPPEGETVQLLSQQGTIACAEGRFVAVLTPERLRVSCVSGEVTLTAGEGERTLRPGQRAMVHKGEPAGPVRDGRVAEAVHWLKAFNDDGERLLTRRQLASVPLTAAHPVLPATVGMERLEVRLLVRGPLALVQFEARLHNEGDEAWSGALRPTDVLLPPAMAEVGPSLSLEAGQDGVARAAAVCVLRNREGSRSLGLNPANWVRGPIGTVDLHVDAAVAGGIDQVGLPLHGVRERNLDGFTWSWQGRDVDPTAPFSLEMAPENDETVDALRLAGRGGEYALIGWQPKPRADQWPGRGAHILIAFDATADFGPGGRGYAQEALEAVLGALPTGSFTALAAYDGRLKLDPDPLLRHFPVRVETMLAALWQLDDTSDGEPAPFLENALALASGIEGESTLLFVTGRNVEPPGEVEISEDVTAIVLALGADAPGVALGDFCARTGGLAAGLPHQMAPRLAALDFLSNLRWPALDAPPVLHLRGTESAVVLTRPGQFANQPVVALCRLDPGADVAGTVEAEAGGRSMKREFELRGEPSAPGGPLIEELVERLRALSGS
ncbi:MAG: hypothetical protein R6X33_19665 [Candidatus Brocadiia bacterium]